MDKSQNFTGTPLLEYIPAQLHENQTWEIVYYVANPHTGKLTRKRNRVKPIKGITQRRQLARRMVIEINRRLQKGWNPFYQNKGTRELIRFIDANNAYINRIKRECADGNLRPDTLRTYKSQVGRLETYVTDVLKTPEMMCYRFDSDFVGEYLDYIRYEKGLSARTRDNYLGFLGTLATFLFEKKYITVNPTEHFGKINKKIKKRTVIGNDLRKAIFMYWENENPNYLNLCMACYYCLIRRTELTKIKVGDVNLAGSTIWVDAQSSKNRTGKHVTIPDKFLGVLERHIENARESDYLFSSDGFAPGKNILRPDRITRHWERMRKDIGLKHEIQWYSLKDSGITDLLAAGVPLIAVRDQARHHSSNQTDAYTPRQMLKANQEVKNANL